MSPPRLQASIRAPRVGPGVLKNGRIGSGQAALIPDRRIVLQKMSISAGIPGRVVESTWREYPGALKPLSHLSRLRPREALRGCRHHVELHVDFIRDSERSKRGGKRRDAEFALPDRELSACEQAVAFNPHP